MRNTIKQVIMEATLQYLTAKGSGQPGCCDGCAGAGEGQDAMGRLRGVADAVGLGAMELGGSVHALASSIVEAGARIGSAWVGGASQLGFGASRLGYGLTDMASAIVYCCETLEHIVYCCATLGDDDDDDDDDGDDDGGGDGSDVLEDAQIKLQPGTMASVGKHGRTVLTDPVVLSSPG